MNRFASLLLAVGAVGCASPTTLTVNLLANGNVSVSAMQAQIDAFDAAGHTTTQTVPFSGAGLQLPARFVVDLPAQPALVTVSVTGMSIAGQSIAASEMTMSVPHEDVQLSFWLFGAPGDPTPTPTSDAGVPLDLAAPVPLDGGSAGGGGGSAGGGGGSAGGGGGSAGGGGGGGCGVCSAPSVCCGSSCVDPTHDPNNCNGCGNFCGSGVCGPTLTASMTDGTAPANWHFNARAGASGGAFYDTSADLAVLTNDTTGQTASILYNHPIVTDTFDASFDFRISVSGFPYADGMAFVLIKSNSAVANIATAVGIGGGGLGMIAPTPQGSSAILSGYAVELDTYDNDNPNGGCGENVDGDHVNVDTLASCSIGSNGSVPTPLSQAQAFQLADGLWHTLQLHLAQGQLSVTMKSGASTKALFTNVPLTGFNAGDSYFYGFSGATGGFGERAEVRNVAVSFPTPRCL